IAFYKNNLFGLGAFDSNPVVGARSYNNARESIFDYAQFTGSGKSEYSHPNGIYYFGSHYGNKGSGMNVNYATDPYWGEKQAANSHNTDYDCGGQDYMANTIGVTTKNNVVIYKKPNTNNPIYTLKNNNKNISVEKIPAIVFDKVLGNDGKYWYKVYSDAALNNNQNIDDNIDYTFETSYGYIKEEDLNVLNNQPVITANDIIIKQNDPLNLLTGVTAIDAEDGNITPQINIIGEVNTNLIGEQIITYTVEDSNRFQASKEITVTVTAGDEPYIIAHNKIVSQYTDFNPLLDVTANDYNDGDITSDIIVEGVVNTDELGEYEVIYKVTNSIGKSYEKTIKVTVIPNDPPVINANNRTIKIGDTFEPLSGVTANDKEDGQITNIEVVTNDVDTTKVGTYKVIYKVIDKANNEVTKEIFITVEEINYIKKTGDFYFEKMDYNKTTDKLDVAGYLAIKGINNTKNDNIKYDLIIKSNTDNTEVVKSLERWLSGNPTRSYSDGIYNYSATWFKGSVDLSDLKSGEYTLYVRARLNNFETTNLFRNVLGKSMTRKAEHQNGTGFVFRNNNYLKNYPIELFVSKNGLISKTPPPHSSNMFNSYTSLNFNGKYLNIIGTSYNIDSDYSSKASVERHLILENIDNEERFTYNIGSYVGSNIPLRLSDGKSKVRGWFNTDNKVDVTNIPVGKYKIYIKTKTGNVEDHGELNDIFLKNIVSTTEINNKTYSISLNKNARFRLELNVK
ncbi:MAG: DUF5011 domain-containing protein, partial [Bacilli bacterium]|nr:DUF5011 domain-containing protein [Bacilli bacterium]